VWGKVTHTFVTGEDIIEMSEWYFERPLLPIGSTPKLPNPKNLLYARDTEPCHQIKINKEVKSAFIGNYAPRLDSKNPFT